MKSISIISKSRPIVKSFNPNSFFQMALLLWAIAIAGPISAQQIGISPWNDPAINWLTPAQAQTEVQTELNLLEPQLAPLTPGTGPHTDLLREILFYKSILLSLTGGVSVQQSIEKAIPEAASLGGAFEHAFTPEATLRGLCADAIDLLSN
jgi:hypothetical protein